MPERHVQGHEHVLRHAIMAWVAMCLMRTLRARQCTIETQKCSEREDDTRTASAVRAQARMRMRHGHVCQPTDLAGCEERLVLVRVSGTDVQLTLEGRLVLETHLLTALKVWRQGPGCEQSCFGTRWARYVCEPVDLEVISVRH